MLMALMVHCWFTAGGAGAAAASTLTQPLSTTTDTATLTLPKLGDEISAEVEEGVAEVEAASKDMILPKLGDEIWAEVEEGVAEVEAASSGFCTVCNCLALAASCTTRSQISW